MSPYWTYTRALRWPHGVVLDIKQLAECHRGTWKPGRVPKTDQRTVGLQPPKDTIRAKPPPKQGFFHNEPCWTRSNDHRIRRPLGRPLPLPESRRLSPSCSSLDRPVSAPRPRRAHKQRRPATRNGLLPYDLPAQAGRGDSNPRYVAGPVFSKTDADPWLPWLWTLNVTLSGFPVPVRLRSTIGQASNCERRNSACTCAASSNRSPGWYKRPKCPSSISYQLLKPGSSLNAC